MKLKLCLSPVSALKGLNHAHANLGLSYGGSETSRKVHEKYKMEPVP